MVIYFLNGDLEASLGALGPSDPSKKRTSPPIRLSTGRTRGEVWNLTRVKAGSDPSRTTVLWPHSLRRKVFLWHGIRVWSLEHWSTPLNTSSAKSKTPWPMGYPIPKGILPTVKQLACSQGGTKQSKENSGTEARPLKLTNFVYSLKCLHCAHHQSIHFLNKLA